MFKNIINVFKKIGKKQDPDRLNKDEAKERLHLVLLQDRANVSADFLDMMKQEIIEVIKKYIDIDEKEIDVKLTNKQNSDGTTGAPALYANIPIVGIKSETRKRTNKIKLEELGNNEDSSKVNSSKKRADSKETKNKKSSSKSEKVETAQKEAVQEETTNNTENEVSQQADNESKDAQKEVSNQENNTQENNVVTKQEEVKSKKQPNSKKTTSKKSTKKKK